MSRILNILSWAWDKGIAAGIIDEAADEGYNTAIDMCGNEGQVAIIDMTGYDAFVSAAEAAYNDDDGLGILISACPHPDAVGEILEESYGVIQEYISEVNNDMFGDDGESEESDEWD